MSDLTKILKKEFRDKEYRHAYVDEFLNVSIATQIKVLREQRKWTQTELAELVAPPMKQTRISIMENVNYSSWSINTLRKLAEAFDLTLRVSFEGFGERLKDIERIKREALERPSFEDDPAFTEKKLEGDSGPLLGLGLRQIPAQSFSYVGNIPTSFAPQSSYSYQAPEVKIEVKPEPIDLGKYREARQKEMESQLPGLMVGRQDNEIAVG